MLRPYIYVACEKVIIAKDEVASLIGLFSKLVIKIPVGTDIPRNAVAPKEWCVFSIWETEPGDERREYTVCTEVLYPDRSQFVPVMRNRINVELNKRAQTMVQIEGFPVGQPGEHTVRTWIEENNQRVFGPIEFGLGLEIIRVEAAQNPITPPVPAP